MKHLECLWQAEPSGGLIARWVVVTGSPLTEREVDALLQQRVVGCTSEVAESDLAQPRRRLAGGS